MPARNLCAETCHIDPYYIDLSSRPARKQCGEAVESVYIHHQVQTNKVGIGSRRGELVMHEHGGF
jgi:hypothetical protein